MKMLQLISNIASAAYNYLNKFYSRCCYCMNMCALYLWCKCSSHVSLLVDPDSLSLCLSNDYSHSEAVRESHAWSITLYITFTPPPPPGSYCNESYCLIWYWRRDSLNKTYHLPLLANVSGHVQYRIVYVCKLEFASYVHCWFLWIVFILINLKVIYGNNNLCK